MGRVAPLRRSLTRTASIVSIADVEEGGQQQRRRRGSSTRPSPVIAEGSNSRKRERSPLEEGTITNKRVRGETSNARTTKSVQEETVIPEESRRGIPNEEGEPLPNTDLSEEECNGRATPGPRPPVREHQRSNRKSRQVVLNVMNWDHR